MYNSQIAVICVDNIFDKSMSDKQNHWLFQEQMYSVKIICRKVMGFIRNRVAIVTFAPPEIVVPKCKPGQSSIDSVIYSLDEVKLNSIDNTGIDVHNANVLKLLQCLRISYNILKDIGNTKKNLICFLKSSVDVEDQLIQATIEQIMNKNNPDIDTKVVLFGNYVSKNAPKFAKILFSEVNQEHLKIYKIFDITDEGLTPQLTDMNLFWDIVNQQKCLIDIQSEISNTKKQSLMLSDPDLSYEDMLAIEMVLKENKTEINRSGEQSQNKTVSNSMSVTKGLTKSDITASLTEQNSKYEKPETISTYDPKSTLDIQEFISDSDNEIKNNSNNELEDNGREVSTRIEQIVATEDEQMQTAIALSLMLNNKNSQKQNDNQIYSRTSQTTGQTYKRKIKKFRERTKNL